MVSVNMLAFREPKRQRCELCNQRKPVTRLALFHESGQVLGDLELCDECAAVLEDALMHGVTVQEIDLSGL